MMHSSVRWVVICPRLLVFTAIYIERRGVRYHPMYSVPALSPEDEAPSPDYRLPGLSEHPGAGDRQDTPHPPSKTPLKTGDQRRQRQSTSVILSPSDFRDGWPPPTLSIPPSRSLRQASHNLAWQRSSRSVRFASRGSIVQGTTSCGAHSNALWHSKSDSGLRQYSRPTWLPQHDPVRPLLPRRALASWPGRAAILTLPN